MRERPGAQPERSGEQPGRLRKRRQFLAAARGERAVTPTLILQAVRREGEETCLGFTVSRKVGNAVERNRVKRRLREAARALSPRHAEPERHYVLIGRRDTLTASYDSILQDLARAFKRANKRTAAVKDPSDG
ncbi:ribonuclease P protein component [Lutibaculum baratangense]|uniref:Ribonuclease P protein component n=1 Tax=Lutibaculum baratangense AMV1 TaxID=631454 RepID=V4R4V6_9HYPH|nr:ribonuclease P protein component [Lutibaculum baratangense]ESR26977.1 Ribonuclease P protein component [Lutibaculum baratangense AMV1]